MKKRFKKSLILLVSVAVLACAAVGGVMAYLTDTTTPIENTFNPSKVTTEVTEDPFDKVAKTNVQIKNTGDTEAYIRAAVVVTWQNSAGEIHNQMPVTGTDYTISFNYGVQESFNGGQWTLSSDGFYYWNMPVAKDASTGILITSCTPVAGRAPADYTLHVEILGSGIQSKPATVVTTEWASGVQSASPNGGALSIKQ